VTADLRPGVLFDVDGTLVDINYLHTLAWSRALRDAGEWAPMNANHRLIGMGGDQLVPELLGHDNPKASAARAGHYRELIGDVRTFPGAPQLLRTLHGRGVVVVLATSSPGDELEVLREVLDADDAIDGQTNADDVEDSKPARKSSTSSSLARSNSSARAANRKQAMALAVRRKRTSSDAIAALPRVTLLLRRRRCQYPDLLAPV
jgi:phosphoglycolate phosphatase-like HAD superfamily hydrolase